LKLEFFIAKKIIRKTKDGFSNERIHFSKPIVNLAIIGITLGITIMILSSSIAIGFQTEIKNKVLGFGSHFQISEVFENQSFESARMSNNPNWLVDLRGDPLIQYVQKVALKPGIIQSKEVTDSTQSGKEIRDLTGIIFKGVGQEYDQKFIADGLIKGQFPLFETSRNGFNDSILISNHTAKQLKLNLYDKVSCFFVSANGPQQRFLTVGGIYETGLEDFDKQFAFIDINLIQQVNQWGISVFLEINEVCTMGVPTIEAKAFGGNGNYLFKWDSFDFQGINKIPLCPIRDTTIMVIASDALATGYNEKPEISSVPDTAWLSIKVEGNGSCNCNSPTQNILIDYLNDSVSIVSFNELKITTTLKTSGGSHYAYCGGFEVGLKEFEDLSEGKKTIQYYTESTLNVQSITERYEEIFKWLDMLDMNVYIILSLMIIVAIINMIAALLVIILERTRMIGILKALGAKNWTIRKIFIIQGGFIVLRGMFFGNLIAFGIILLQNTFQIITLPQENYYVSIVPMYFPIISIITINALAFIICAMSLVLPTVLVTKISPIKAIKFE
jgi:lipoprotein-releasing system permease protein